MISAEQWIPADGLTLEPNAMNAAKEQKMLSIDRRSRCGKN